MIQQHRNRVFHDFRQGACRCLVSSGMLASKSHLEFLRLQTFLLAELISSLSMSSSISTFLAMPRHIFTELGDQDALVTWVLQSISSLTKTDSTCTESSRSWEPRSHPSRRRSIHLYTPNCTGVASTRVCSRHVRAKRKLPVFRRCVLDCCKGRNC